MRSLLYCAVAVLAACGTERTEVTSDLPRFEAVGAGEDFPVSVPSAFGSERGYLVVRENRSDPESAEIRLPVAIVKAKNPVEEKAPVVFLAGGPGSAALSAAAYPGAYPWTEGRDFIVIGQRGTANAEPSLQCADYARSRGTEELAVQAEEAKACAETLRGAGVDLSAYHSSASAADIDDLAEALDIDRLALFGLSYGTRLALTIMRDSPERVASAVLDSPLPHSAHYDDESAGNYAAVLRAIAEACAAQAACGEAYPGLGDRYFEAVENARTQPVTLPDGSVLEAGDLATIANVGTRPGIAEAPFLMDAVARGDMDILEARLGGPEVTGSGNDGFAWGMRLAVWCSEALPFSERSEGGVPDDSFGGLESAVVAPEVCAAFGVPPRPQDEVAVTSSSIPTLIIAGEYDPNTPPKWGFDAARTLSRSRVVVIPQGGHTETTNWGGDGCAMAIAARFFDEPGAVLEGDDALACLEEREPIVFALPE